MIFAEMWRQSVIQFSSERGVRKGMMGNKIEKHCFGQCSHNWEEGTRRALSARPCVCFVLKWKGRLDTESQWSKTQTEKPERAPHLECGEKRTERGRLIGNGKVLQE